MAGKEIVSPVSTGGAGSDFERVVGAYYLAATVIGATARGCQGRIVEEVRFQRLYQGEPLDDLIVVLRSPPVSGKLALQIKRDLVFGQEDELFDDVMRRCWETFMSPKFNADIDRFGVVLALYSKKIDEQYQSVLTWARCSATAADFFERIGTKGLSNQTQRSFVDLIRKKINLYSGKDEEDCQIWKFLKAMVLLRFDFHNEASADQAHVLQLLTLSLPQGVASTAGGVLLALTEIAAKAARTAGSLNREALSSELLGAGVTIVPRDDSSDDLGKLRRHANFILDEIGDRIGPVGLGRTGLVGEAQEDLGSHPIIEIVGSPGSGKSALLKALVQRQEQEGPVLLLAADRLVGPGWDGFAATLQLERSLDDLLVSVSVSTRPTVFVDGVDRIVDAGHRLVVNDLLRRMGAMPLGSSGRRWTFVFTARQDNLEEVHGWLAWEVLGLPRRFEVPELSNDELKTIVEGIPRLGPLVGSGEVGGVIRNPYMLQLLADERIVPDTTASPPVATECELSTAWWERLVGRGGALGKARQLLLLELGRLAAREPGPWLLTAVSQPAALKSLEDDHILLREPGRDVYRFSHDILEDWVVCRVLDQRLPDLPKYLRDLSQPFGLYRPLQLLACALLEREKEDQRWRGLFMAIESTSGLQPRWRQAVLTAPLVSTRSFPLLEQVTAFLLADKGSRLCNLLRIIRAVEVVPDPGIEAILDQLVSAGDDPFAVLMRSAIPRWRRWGPMALWITAHARQIPEEARPDVTEFMETWQVKSPYKAPFRREFGLLALEWLKTGDLFDSEEFFDTLEPEDE